MRAITHIEDVWEATEDLIGRLRGTSGGRLGEILEHRLHRVAWTTATELLEELKRVLEIALAGGEWSVPTSLSEEARQLLEVVTAYYRARLLT